MYDSYDYWSNIFSPNRFSTIQDWNVVSASNRRYPELEGYLVFNPSFKNLTDNLQMVGIPSFCSETLLRLPNATLPEYHLAYALYVLPGERQLRTKRDFHYLHDAITSGHIIKVRTSTDRLYYLHSNFILNDERKALVMPYSFYTYSQNQNIGLRRINRELYVNPVLMSYKNDFIKKTVVHELMESLALFSFSVCMKAMEENLINFYDINRAGFSFDLDKYHDMLSDIMVNQSFINSVIDNL